MPPERLARIVEQVNAQRPDLVLIAGDFVGDRSLDAVNIRPAEAWRRCAGLRARLGAFAVLGNHDYWRDGRAMRAALTAVGDPGARQSGGAGRAARARRARRPVGPAIIATTRPMRAMRGAARRAGAAQPQPRSVRDPAARYRPDARRPYPLRADPRCRFYGALSTDSAYGERYACGFIERERAQIDRHRRARREHLAAAADGAAGFLDGDDRAAARGARSAAAPAPRR